MCVQVTFEVSAIKIEQEAKRLIAQVEVQKSEYKECYGGYIRHIQKQLKTSNMPI